jgi:hypothetical protein
MTKPEKLRMYLVLRWDISVPMAVCSAGHAALGTYLTWEKDPIMQKWRETSFVKIWCKALHEDHWKWIKTLGEHRVFTESTLNHAETCIGFKVVENPSHLFKDLPLWTSQ